MRRTGKCSFCGKKVIQDDEAQTFAHDEPVCQEFAKAHSGADEVREVQPEAVEAHLDALARRVRSSTTG